MSVLPARRSGLRRPSARPARVPGAGVSRAQVLRNQVRFTQTQRARGASRTLRCAAVLILPLLGAGLDAPPAAARSASVAPQAVAPATAWTGAVPEPEPHCVRMRRKFWQTGEGWIVKAVSICR